ncbi:alpha/beta hydrolase [Mycoplasma todarodis]|uniref:Serine aminopeptidase S33 domain-containing protein n=1 Tax=Mycoplasma todarodis TaxID=1937191 RepID=A0A4R0XJI8_9MOLU|nr:alpha/beta fold hydrolase [Mycoplasma todarodis]TCG10594.1 hypothetical protein C4B25_03565 [Mycoplasma todarodis]
MKLSEKIYTTILIIIMVVIPILLIVALILSFLTAKNMANPKSYDSSEIIEDDAKGVSTLFDLHKYIKNGPMIVEELTTIDNELVEYEIWGKKSNDKFVILVHGMYNSRKRMYKYAKIWNDMGYNAIAFDGRGWSSNAKLGKCTLGYKEPRLVQEIYLDLVKKYKTQEIGLHGESMGGATVFNWVKQYRKFTPIKFIVSEAGYMNFRIPAITGMGRHNLPWWLSSALYPFVKIWLLTFGINLWKGSVGKKDIRNWFDMPKLLIHSKSDDVVIWSEYQRIKKMFDKERVEFNKFEVEKAQHVRKLTDKNIQKEWVERLKKFIKEVESEK